MTANSSQIAKNTIFLYIRMLIVLGVTLYTSRIVLDLLGIDDYGIYNLVGGVVVLFTFLSSAMTTATQRYLCTSIGEGKPGETQRIFSSSLAAHIMLIVLLLAVAETVGLWFVRTQLVIPAERMFATEVLYQLSIFTAVLNVYRIPFTAAILAYEKMSFYAWSGVVEVLLKLLILWPLALVTCDRLILYGFLMAGVNLVILMWYARYCHLQLPDTRHRFRSGTRHRVKEIFKFAGWSSFSAVANIGSRQGLNILVNIFFGVALNAAIGVMMQVSNAVYQFIINFMSALNPPLMKEYARHNFESVRSLLVSSCKFSFYLMLLLSTPIIFNIDQILHLWLKEVPPLTGAFCAFSLVALIPNTIGGPLWTVMQASGHIQKYQIVISSVIILNIPTYWILLRLGVPAPYTLLVQFVTNLAVAFVGAHMGLRSLGLKMKDFTRQIILPAFGTLIICWVLTFGALSLLPPCSGIGHLAIRCVAEMAIVIAVTWFIGLSADERLRLRQILHTKFLHK